MLGFTQDSQYDEIYHYRNYIYERSSQRIYSPLDEIRTHIPNITVKDIVGGRLKRFFDFTISLHLLIFLSPFLLFIWVLIKLSSKGPGLFKQSRGGVHGKPFIIYKFRTMVSHEKYKQAAKEDIRITPLGRFLRKTSIDEIPQLFNVLIGNMSLVGPRPHVIDHDKELMQFDRRYAIRFLARPGLTGLAQVSGSRGPTHTPELKLKRIELDLNYVENWSLRKDLFIVIKTACCVLLDKNAF